MAKQTINVGTTELAGDGESLRTAFQKVNSNFDELYSTGGTQGYTGSQGSTGTVGFTGSIGSTGTVGFTGSQGSTGTVGFTGSAGITSNFSAVAEHILPATNLTYDLGSTSSQWRSLYVGTSTIYLGGTALSVSGGNLTVGGSPVTGGGNAFNQSLNTECRQRSKRTCACCRSPHSTVDVDRSSASEVGHNAGSRSPQRRCGQCRRCQRFISQRLAAGQSNNCAVNSNRNRRRAVKARTRKTRANSQCIGCCRSNGRRAPQRYGITVDRDCTIGQQSIWNRCTVFRNNRSSAHIHITLSRLRDKHIFRASREVNQSPSVAGRQYSSARKHIT